MSPAKRGAGQRRFYRDHGDVKERRRASCWRNDRRRVVAIDQRADWARAETFCCMGREADAFAVIESSRPRGVGRKGLMPALQRMPIAVSIAAKLVDERVQPRAQAADAPDEGQQRERR